MIRNRTTTLVIFLVAVVVFVVPLAGLVLGLTIWFAVDTNGNPWTILLLVMAAVVFLLVLTLIGTLVWAIRKSRRLAAALLDQLNPATFSPPLAPSQ